MEELRRLTRVEWPPDAADWWKAGILIQRIGDAHDWDRRKRQEFQNDALIALTARRYGATIITTNRNDFELLAKELKVRVLVIQA